MGHVTHLIRMVRIPSFLQNYLEYIKAALLIICTFLGFFFVVILVPMRLEYEATASLLRAIIDVCGMLIGFIGVMTTFVLTSLRDEIKTQSGDRRRDLLNLQRDVLTTVITTLLFLMTCVLIGLVGLGSLVRPFSSTLPVVYSVLFLIGGVMTLFWLLYLQSKSIENP